MNPTISKGSLVIVNKKKTEFPQNDIITFKYPVNMQRTITHRIVGRVTESNYDYFVTKGDNNKENDPWKVTPDLIVGSVVLIIPTIGYLVEFISKPLGLVVLVIIPAMILIYKEIEVILNIITSNLRLTKHKKPNIFRG
jgi:signal peptidase